MHLTSVSVIRGILGYDDMQDITDAVMGALDSAEPIIASVLHTDFARASFTDIFWVPETDIYDGKPHNEFRLTRGFVSGASTVKVGSTIADFGSGAATTLTTAYLNAEKGVVREHASIWAGKFVQIEYDAGFEPDEETATQYKLDQVPTWLQEAAKLQAFILLENHQVIKEAEITQDVSSMKMMLKTLLDRHKRYAPLARQPI